MKKPILLFLCLCLSLAVGLSACAPATSSGTSNSDTAASSTDTTAAPTAPPGTGNLLVTDTPETTVADMGTAGAGYAFDTITL